VGAFVPAALVILQEYLLIFLPLGALLCRPSNVTLARRLLLLPLPLVGFKGSLLT